MKITRTTYIEMIRSVQLLAFVLILFSLGCSNSNEQYKKIDLPNFHSETVIHLQKHQTLDHVSMLSLNIEGKFNGYTQLWLGTSDSVFSRKFDYKNGVVDLNFKMGDWYNDDCYLKLVPIESSKGKIELRYTFH
jgi:hypothetical protein